MEDVLMDQDGADPESSPLTVLYIEEALRRSFLFSPQLCNEPENWVAKIHKELGILEEQLPETIYARAYESRMDLLIAVIVGPQGTPYQGGLFLFDVCFPSNYPASPPLLHYHSGGLAINLSLFKSGEVCLEVPTQSGGLESMWVPGMTTMLQLLVSIQNRILNVDPLFNELAYATMKGSSYG
uniref:putative ubiquitin-conjugating enzyme E2 39 n=1 Tax=Erigeron canadensis TaxID=72917 RepID=UPI001CB93D74|nr:putative ubiquitin-conjugating enzyme E2 39 [Erigeron canadensis]